MARYSYDQVFQMIDESYTPEFREIEKQIEKQHYLNFFTEMHNYISENIIELPFDADVILEEDKSVWDKSDTGWGGFWRNIWRVIKNIFESFWKFIKTLVGISHKEQVSDEKLKNNAQSAQSAQEAIRNFPDSGVKQAFESNPQNKEEFKKSLEEIKSDISKLKERYNTSAGKDLNPNIIKIFDDNIENISKLIGKVDKGDITKSDINALLDPMLMTAASANSTARIQKLNNYIVSTGTVLLMLINSGLSMLNIDLNRSLKVKHESNESRKNDIKKDLAKEIYKYWTTGFTGRTGMGYYLTDKVPDATRTQNLIEYHLMVSQLLINSDFKNEAAKKTYEYLKITNQKDIDAKLDAKIKSASDMLDIVKDDYAHIPKIIADTLQIEGSDGYKDYAIENDDNGLLTSSNALNPDKVNENPDVNDELGKLLKDQLSDKYTEFMDLITKSARYAGLLYKMVVSNKEVSFSKVTSKINQLALVVTNIFKKKENN